ncbi:MAG: ABC transporter ATP-binding protein, partial [Rhizobiales bacterium]|nr:ABC transporter ATP-binding protein [Hyphomicrobiales bacterium]
MSVHTATGGDDQRGRPPRAVVGSQINQDEQMFGALFDGRVVRRFMEYVQPYRRRVVFSIIAVLIATLAQLAIPLVIRHGIDIAVQERGGSGDLLNMAIIAFALVITVNFIATWWQD